MIELTVGGVAGFDNLSVNLPGTGRLRALVGDPEQAGSLDIDVYDPSE